MTVAAVDLYWIPLGAGAHVVRLSGKLYEAIRPSHGIAHGTSSTTPLWEVEIPDGRSVIESAPIRDERGPERGVVAEGPVGTRWAGRFRLFRYEIRRWHEGSIPDASEAVSSPVRVADDLARARADVETERPTPPSGGRAPGWNAGLVVARRIGARGPR